MNIEIELDPSNCYDYFALAKKLLELREVQNDNYTSYYKFVQTGDLEDHYDYGSGFLDVSVYVRPNSENDTYVVRIWFATPDDGDFGGWSKNMPFDQASVLARRIAYEVFGPMVKLPTQDKINELLRPYGLYVCHE